MLQGECVFGESVWCQQWLALRGGANELPPALLTTRAKEGLSFLLFAFTQDTKPVSKMQKKNMHAILKTTSHNAAEVSAQEDRKPDIILDYNINKGGGDNLDKVTGTYSCKKSTASGLSWYATISLQYQPPLTYKGFVVQWAETYLKGKEEELVEVIFGGAWRGPCDSLHVQSVSTSTAASAAALVRMDLIKSSHKGTGKKKMQLPCKEESQI